MPECESSVMGSKPCREYGRKSDVVSVLYYERRASARVDGRIKLSCLRVDCCRARRSLLRNGSFQRQLRARFRHLDDACALRPDAAEQVRASRLRSRGLRV